MRKPNPRKTSKISEIKARAKAVALYEVFDNYREVGRMIRRSDHFVRSAARREKINDTFEDRPRSGRPKKVTPKVESRINSLMHNQKGSSLRRTRVTLISEGIPLAISTIRLVNRDHKLRF